MENQAEVYELIAAYNEHLIGIAEKFAVSVDAYYTNPTKENYQLLGHAFTRCENMEKAIKVMTTSAHAAARMRLIAKRIRMPKI
jgi:hypothetical protein